MKRIANSYRPNSSIFYAYPAGNADRFFNKVPTWIEELVAARALTMINEQDALNAVVFNATVQNGTLEFLKNSLGVPMMNLDRIISLPAEISVESTGIERNERIKQALLQLVGDGQLVMAQPFSDDRLDHLYSIPPQNVQKLNDKRSMAEYVPSALLPETYSTYQNGQEFGEAQPRPPFPCVVKVTSSSSGDGVRICAQQSELEAAQKDFAHILSDIYIQEFVDAEKNIGIQFTLPFDPNAKGQILNVSEQITTKDGIFMGSKISNNRELPPQLDAFLFDNVFPFLSANSWHGIGNVDVLLSKEGKYYCIDPNFRFTAASPFCLQMARGEIQAPSIISFIGRLKRPIAEARQILTPFAKHQATSQIMSMVAMVQDEEKTVFNAAVFSNGADSFQENAANLLQAGIESSILRKLAKG